MSEPDKTPDSAPATKADLQSEKWSINFVTLISAGGGLMMSLAAILGGGWLIVDRANAAGKDAAHVVVDPLVPRVVFLEAQMPFVVTETREIRVEQRALAAKGMGAPELARPMAPLPLAPDAGR